MRAALGILALALAGCRWWGFDGPRFESPLHDAGPTSWHLTELPSAPGVFADTLATVTLTFDWTRGLASGTTGCNGYTSPVSALGASVSFDSITHTQRSCGPALDSLDAAVVRALEATMRYRMSGTSRLELRTVWNEPLARFERGTTAAR